MGRIVGYHGHFKDGQGFLVNDVGDVRTEPPYLDWLMETHVGPEFKKVAYDIDQFVAVILRLIDLTEEEGKGLLEAGELYIRPYRLTYYPSKYFGIYKGGGLQSMNASFYDAGQYLEAPSLERNVVPEKAIYKAKEARDVAARVSRIFFDLGWDGNTITSPIRSLEKSALAGLNLPTHRDIPPAVNDMALRSCRGSWVEAYKLGHFKKCFDYDLRSAYPFFLSQLLDLRRGDWTMATERPEGALYGFQEGTVAMNASFHPVLYGTEAGERSDYSYTPTGEWQTCLAADVVDFVRRYKLGEFKPEVGWWWIPNGTQYEVMKGVINWLYQKRQGKEGLELKVVKRAACFSGDTLVWTETGLKNVGAVDIGERVYSVNPETLGVELKDVVALHRYHYKGKMVRVLCPRKYDFLVTPEHRFLLERYWEARADWLGRRGGFQFMTLGEAFGEGGTYLWRLPSYKPIAGKKQKMISLWEYIDGDDCVAVFPNKRYSSTFEKDGRFVSGHHWGHGVYLARKKDIGLNPSRFENTKDCQIYVKHTRKGSYIPWRFKMADMLELMGWYISEGCAYVGNDRRGGRSPYYYVGFVNKDWERIGGLLARMRIPYGTSIQKNTGCGSLKVSSKALYRFMVEAGGVKAEGKQIRGWVFDLDSSLLKHLFNTLMAGDGTVDKRGSGFRYTTVSSELAMGMQRLCLHLGWKSTHYVEEAKGERFGKRDLHRVIISTMRCGSNVDRAYVSEEEYDGMVYCVTVKDNGTLLAGRGGRYEFTGNSALWGRTLELRGEDYGPNFNPVYGALVEARTRIAVAKFVFDNKVDPIHVAVDGVLCGSRVKVPEDGGMGTWKVAHTGGAIVVSSGVAAVKGKEGAEDFSIKYEWLRKRLADQPGATEYEMKKMSVVTLAKALNADFAKLGELEEITKAIRIGGDGKRLYWEEPVTGGDLMANVYDSEPVDVSVALGKGVA